MFLSIYQSNIFKISLDICKIRLKFATITKLYQYNEKTNLQTKD